MAQQKRRCPKCGQIMQANSHVCVTEKVGFFKRLQSLKNLFKNGYTRT